MVVNGILNHCIYGRHPQTAAGHTASLDVQSGQEIAVVECIIKDDFCVCRKKDLRASCDGS